MNDETPAGGPRKWSRPTLIAAGTVTVAAAVSAGLVATGGHSSNASLSSSKAASSAQPPVTSSGSSASSSPSPSATGSAFPRVASSLAASRSAGSAPWSSTSCPSQLASWHGTGAGGQLQVVVTDLTLASQAATSLHTDPASGTVSSSAVAALSSATASLKQSTQTAGKNLIPGCVSAAHQAEVAGLTDLDRAVANFGNAIKATASGDHGSVQRSSQAAVAALQSGSAEMATAIVDVNRYGTR